MCIWGKVGGEERWEERGERGSERAGEGKEELRGKRGGFEWEEEGREGELKGKRGRINWEEGGIKKGEGKN